AYDFDDPDGLVNSLGDDHEGEDEKSLGSGTSEEGALDFEAGTVEGDSGGPLFIKDGNTWKVAGVLSGGAVDPLPNYKDGDYGDISLFTRVSPLVSWINSVIQ
ncbi:MAG: trypsin-like serine protease, partial [Bacteroidetes bacterium]|nr:trypsin-like serine protease [Bacteroidota bacterium]